MTTDVSMIKKALDFFQGEYIEVFDKLDMLTFAFGETSDIDLDRTEVCPVGLEFHNGEERYCYVAEVYFIDPECLVWTSRYNAMLGVWLLPLDGTPGDPDDFARFLIEFKKPIGFRF